MSTESKEVAERMWSHTEPCECSDALLNYMKIQDTARSVTLSC